MVTIGSIVNYSCKVVWSVHLTLSYFAQGKVLVHTPRKKVFIKPMCRI